SIARSYSDPDLPSSNSAAQFNYKDSPLSSSLKSPLDYSMESPNYVAVFKVDCENQSTGLAPPLMFRHSFDCLLDLLNGHGERDGEGDGEGRGNGEVEAEPQPAPAAAAEATTAEATAAEATAADVLTSMKKRVIFADDAGKPLQQVRVFSEPSWAPPKFLSITDPDAADDIEYSSDKSGQFRCQFAQPSSKTHSPCFSLPLPRRLGARLRILRLLRGRRPSLLGQQLGRELQKVSVAKKSASSKSSRPANAYTQRLQGPTIRASPNFSEFSVWDHFADRVYY
uniref:Velvet domain-containing protein n=1 Tax=Macrostomum lignano TaxID=282301 RepID=A0A1I8IXQ2_9PLAT